MSVRTSHVAAASALAAAAFAIPAQAEEGVGFGTTFAGAIFSMSEDLTPNSESTIGEEYVAGDCNVNGERRHDGSGMSYTFGGEAVATSTSQSQPEVTAVKCTLISPAQGIPGERPTLTRESLDVACPGAACSTGYLGFSGWPIRPVKICITGFAVFGPTPAVQKNIIPACSTNTI